LGGETSIANKPKENDMAGTKNGAAKAATTIKEKHGADYYARIGAIGGRHGNTGGFAANRELARTAGAKGGQVSRRGPRVDLKQVEAAMNGGAGYQQIAEQFGVTEITAKRYIERINKQNDLTASA